MDDIIEQCRNLNAMIKSSSEYRTYIRCLNAIRSNEELNRSLKDFKARYDDIMRYTEDNPYDELYRIYYENDDLIHNSIVNDYLRAESAFSKLVKSALDEVCEGIIVGV